MGRYLRGDVILAPVAFEEKGGAKTRPAIVISSTENGEVRICPISSRPPSDAPCIPITLDDFSEGGLDLFSDSYALTTRIRIIRSGEVVGKRGRLNSDCIASVIAHTQGQKEKSTETKKRFR